MKNSLRTLILTLGIVVTTGIGSTAYAQDFSATKCAAKQGQSIQKMCAKYGIEVPKGLTAQECLAIKTKEANTCKAAPEKVAAAAKKTKTCKATPAKVTPAKEAPVKEAPVKEAPAKVTPAKETPAPALTENNKLEQEVATLVNQERAKLGLAPLKLNVELSNVARYKSEDMRDKNYFSHTSPTYGSPFEMMKQFGIEYMAAGENIAMGQPTAAEVMKSWMNSPGHKANILSKNFTEIGVGIAKDENGTIYWTQQFIGK